MKTGNWAGRDEGGRQSPGPCLTPIWSAATKASTVTWGLTLAAAASRAGLTISPRDWPVSSGWEMGEMGGRVREKKE